MADDDLSPIEWEISNDVKHAIGMGENVSVAELANNLQLTMDDMSVQIEFDEDGRFYTDAFSHRIFTDLYEVVRALVEKAIQMKRESK